MGACIALQTAITYPENVLSLFLVSPLPLEEVRFCRLPLGTNNLNSQPARRRRGGQTGDLRLLGGWVQRPKESRQRRVAGRRLWSCTARV